MLPDIPADVRYDRIPGRSAVSGEEGKPSDSIWNGCRREAPSDHCRTIDLPNRLSSKNSSVGFLQKPEVQRWSQTY